MEQELSTAVISSAISENQQQQQQPLCSFVKTSFGRRRHCWICSDVLMDIFPFFDHAQLGLKLALISPRFDVLVDTHFNGKNELKIWRPIAIHNMGTTTKIEKLGIFTKFVQFPIPQRPLHNKIRFELLEIECIDQKVVEFLRFNHQIFDEKGTELSLKIYSSQNANVTPIWSVFVREIWPIFATNIRHFAFPNSDHLSKLLFLTSPTILTDLNQLNSIQSVDLFPDVLGDDDGPNAAYCARQALFKWLHTPRKDGKPKRLSCIIYFTSQIKNRINNFKEAFLRAKTAVSYKIHLTVYVLRTPIEPFELVNERTQEKMTLEKGRENDTYADYLLKRCSIGQMVQWEDENLADNLNKVMFFLNADINCLGIDVPNLFNATVNWPFNLQSAHVTDVAKIKTDDK